MIEHILSEINLAMFRRDYSRETKIKINFGQKKVRIER